MVNKTDSATVPKELWPNWRGRGRGSTVTVSNTNSYKQTRGYVDGAREGTSRQGSSGRVSPLSGRNL